MSGGDAWQTVAPSTNSTIECTMDCGCTVTTMRSGATPNRRLASMTSSPLFIRVDELMVTTGPICHVGWLSACSGVMSLMSARFQPRKGPPEAVTTSLLTSAWVPDRSDCQMAECSESTGLIDLVIAHLRAEKQVTACDDRFLVGERQLRASPQRRNGWFESDRARDAVQHQVGTGTGDGVDRLRPGLNLRVPSSDLLECLMQRRNGGLVIYGHLRHMMMCDLLCQKPHMRASGGQTGDGEPLRMPADDIQTLRADRTGRSIRE